ncbi:MAG: PIN domain-containing protein [Bacteroidetes bacterium]|nr:PIN domain-containing protein [Bacteroidota bacterium]
MDRIFVDTDVLLDLLEHREPFYKSSAYLFSKADRREIQILISSLSFTNIHYILRKKYSNTESRKILSRLRVLVTVATVRDKTIELALASNFSDFEDAVQNYTAIDNGASLIITRNLKDYKQSQLPVMNPDTFLKTMV